MVVESSDLHIVVVYRPPSYYEAENSSVLSFPLDFCLSRRVLLLGDFNLLLLRWASDGIKQGYVTPLNQCFYDLFLILGMTQVVQCT